MQALEYGSTLSGRTLNTPSDWKRAAIVAAAVALAAFAYRSYGSVAGACWCRVLGGIVEACDD